VLDDNPIIPQFFNSLILLLNFSEVIGMSQKRILVLLAPGFEELEAVAVIDILYMSSNM
jgi:hypothetical protein